MAEENAKLIIQLDSSRMSCAGAVAAYLLRRLSARAGAYAPGIQEHLFQAIGQKANGSSVEKVEAWLHGHSPTLAALGYQIRSRRISVETDELVQWVREGNGYRGAVLATDGSVLHGTSDVGSIHAVGLMLNDNTSGIADDSLADAVVIIDPWPGVARFSEPPATLNAARRSSKYAALLMYWTGYG